MKNPLTVEWWNSLNHQWKDIFLSKLEVENLNNDKEINEVLDKCFFITDLKINARDVSDIEQGLSPIANLVNLTSLDLSGNEQDLSPIANLVNLTSLGLSFNEQGLSPIANLVNLTSLSLSFNKQDLSPIANLVNLTSLELNENTQDLSPIANLVNLTFLELDENTQDLSPIANLVNLTSLILSDNKQDLSPIANLVNLTSLNLGSNKQDLSLIANLVNLTSLNLNYNEQDLSPISNLVNLTSLELNENTKDLSPLVNLVNLKSLMISSDVTADVNIESLKDLISDIEKRGGLIEIDYEEYDEDDLLEKIERAKEMRQTGDFLGDFLGENLSVDSIKEYANKLKQANQIPFIHFNDEGLKNELYVFDVDGKEEPIIDIYMEKEYPLNRGTFFYTSQFELNYSHKTWVVFTQDGFFLQEPGRSEYFEFYSWTLWEKVLYTKHQLLDAPVILLAHPSQPGVIEMSISPVLDMQTNVKIWEEEDENGLSVMKKGYDDLTLEKMNFAYQVLNRFYTEVVDKNKNSTNNSIPSEILSLLSKEDFKIFRNKNKVQDKTEVHQSNNKTNNNQNDWLDLALILMILFAEFTDAKLSKEEMNIIGKKAEIYLKQLTNNNFSRQDVQDRLQKAADRYFGLRDGVEEDKWGKLTLAEYNRVVSLLKNDDHFIKLFARSVISDMVDIGKVDGDLTTNEKGSIDSISQAWGIKLKDYRVVVDDNNSTNDIDPSAFEALLGSLTSEENDLELDIAGLEKYKNGDYKGAIENFSKLIELNPTREFGFYNRGLAKNALKDYQGAIEDFSKVIEIDPNNEEAYQQRGKAKSSLEDYLGAIEDYSKAIEFDPDWWGYYSGRGDAKKNLKDYKGAIEDYNKAIELDPENDGVFRERGNAKRELKDYNGALEDFNKAIELKPNWWGNYFQRGYLNTILENHQSVIEDYTKVIELGRKTALSYFSRGFAKSELKDYHGAIEDFNKAIELDPKWIDLYKQRGMAKNSLKDFQGTIEDFNKAIELNPNWWGFYSSRGDAKRNLKEYQGAIEDYNKAIELNPDNKWTYQNRGKAKSNLRDYQGAIEDFSKVIEIDPDYKWAYQERGKAKSSLNDYQGAIGDFSKVIEIDPDYKWAYQERGKAKSNLKEFNEAIDDFSKVIEIDSNYKWAYQERGEAKSNLNDYQGAIEDFSKVIEIDPDYKWAYQERGEAKSSLNDYQGAIEDFNKVIEIDPNYKWAYEHLGIAKSKLKDYQGAIEDFNNAIEKEAKWGSIYYNRGLAKHDQKDYKGALEDYNYCVSQDLLRDIHLWYNIELAKSKLQNYRGEMENLNVDAQDSNYVNAYFNRAENVWEPLILRKKEIEDLNKVIEIDSKHLLAYQNRGQAKSGLKDYQGALKDFSKALKLDPDNDIKYWLYFYIGGTELKLNDFHAAIEYYDKAIEIDPKSEWAYKDRGSAKSSLKDYQGAVEDYNKAIELDPNDKELAEKRDKVKQLLEAGEIKVKKEVNEISNKKLETVDDYNKEIEENSTAFNYCGRGILKYEKKDYYSAIADLLKAIELDPNYAKAYAASADVKKALNDVNGALADYNKALELEPDNKKFIEKRDNLTGSKSNVEHKSDKGVSQKGNVVSFNDIDTWLEVIKNGQDEDKSLEIKKIKPTEITESQEEIVRNIYKVIKSKFKDEGELMTHIFSPTGGCSFYFKKKKVIGISFASKKRVELLILRDFNKKYFRPNIKNLFIENIREVQISKKVPWGYAFYRVIDLPENINENMDKIVGLIGDGITTIKYGKVLSLKKNQFRKLKPIFEGIFDI